MDAGLIFVLVLVGLALVTVFAGVKTVPQGFEWTIERFGRYSRTLRPGISVITPYIETVGKKMNMMERVLDVPNQEVITKDNVMVRTDGVAFIQVIDASRAAYEVNDLENGILNLALTNLRTVLGSMDLDEILSKRDEINERLLIHIDKATNPWGVKVTRVEIKDITPPHDIIDAMARQMKAERDKRAEILQAEGDKTSAILRAEGEKQSKILEAEGRREAAFRDAEAREREAEAEAKATESVNNAVASGDVAAINYFIAQRYVDAFEKLASAPNQKTIIVPAEMSALVGSLGGIQELVNALGRSGSSRGDTAEGGKGPWDR